MQTLKVVSSFPQVRPRSHALRGNTLKGALRRELWSVYRNAHRANTGRGASGTAFPRSAWERGFTSSQAPAWEFSAGSSSFPSREARASLTGFPSRSLGTSVTITQELT